MTGEEQTLAAVKDWLKYAPEPSRISESKRWHVFISYRSVNRAWVLNLYDALRLVGFDVFLDQLELVPGASLVNSLENALEQSESGVIAWSMDNKGSEWCQAEYRAMVAMQKDQKSRFRFVIAKLDPGDLPLFARDSVYIDFSDSIEGPRGAGLLRIMYGLVGKPLSAEAVRFAEKVDEETKAELNKIKAAYHMGDAHRLFELGTSRTLGWLTSPLLACDAASKLIGLGKNDTALEVLRLAEESFPKSIRPKHLRALALTHIGQWKAAQQVLSELYATGHRDPETLGLFARTWEDRYQASNKPLHLETALHLYEEAFTYSDSKDHNVLIKAALLRGLLGKSRDAKEAAVEVERIAGGQPEPGNYWTRVTLAEAQLIQEHYDEAATLYREALVMLPEAAGSHAVTLDQARRIMDALNTPPTQRQRIEQAFL